MRAICALRFALRDVDAVQVRALDWRRSIVAVIGFWAPGLFVIYALLHIPRS